MSLEITIENPTEWDNIMRDLSLPFRAGPTRDFLEDDAVDYFKAVTALRFSSEGADVGGWEQLSAQRVEGRAREGSGPRPINDHKGVMRRWMTQFTRPKASVDEEGYEVQYPGRAPNELTEKKLAFAQKVPVGSRREPRKVNVLYPEHQEAIEELFQNMVEDTWRSAGVV